MCPFVQRSWLLPVLALALSAFTNADELPSVLTVQAHRAGSHQGKGWEHFTDAAIRIRDRDRPGQDGAAMR